MEPFQQGNNSEITAAAYEPRFSLIAFGTAEGRLFVMNKRNGIVSSRVTANAPICTLVSCPNSSSFVSLFSQYTFQHHPSLLKKKQDEPDKNSFESLGSKFRGAILAHWIVTPERCVPKIASFKEDVISIAVSPSTPNFVIILQAKGSLLGFSLEKMDYTELYINQFEKSPCKAISCPRGMKYYVAHDKIECVDISSMELDSYGPNKVTSLDVFDDTAAVIASNGFPQIIKGSKVLKEIKLQKDHIAIISHLISNDKWICVVRTENGDVVLIDGKKVPNIPQNTYFVPNVIVNYQNFFERSNPLFIKLLTNDGRIFTIQEDSSIYQPIFPPYIEAASVYQDGGRVLACERKIADVEIEVEVPVETETQQQEPEQQAQETEENSAAPEEEKSKKEKKKEKKEKKKEEKAKKKEEKQRAKEEKERLKKEEKERKKAEKEKKKEEKSKQASGDQPKEEPSETKNETTEDNQTDKVAEEQTEQKQENTAQPTEQKEEPPKPSQEPPKLTKEEASKQQPQETSQPQQSAPQIKKETRIVKQERFILHSLTKNSYITSKEYQLPLPILYCSGFLVCSSDSSVDLVDSLTGNTTKCFEKHVSRFYEINKKLYIIDDDGNQFCLQDDGKLLELKEEKGQIPFSKYQKEDVIGIRKINLTSYLYLTTKRTTLFKDAETEIYEEKENLIFYEIINENGCVHSPPSEENPEAQQEPDQTLPVYLLVLTNKNIYLYDVFDQLKRIRKMKVDDEPIEATIFEWGGMIIRMNSCVTIYPLPDFTLQNLGTLKVSSTASTNLIKKNGLFGSDKDGTTLIYSNDHKIPMLFSENTPSIEEPSKKSFFGLVAKAAPNQQEADSSFGFSRPKSSLQQTTEVMQQLLVTAMERSEQLNEIEMKANRLYEHAKQFHEATKKFKR